MKFLICLLCICGTINSNTSFAFAISKPVADKPGTTIFSNSLKASEFVKLSAKDFSLITEKKMSIWNRVSFSFLKMKMKHDLKKDSNLTIADYYSKNGKRHLGALWIVLICIAGLAIIFFILVGIGLSKLQ